MYLSICVHHTTHMHPVSREKQLAAQEAGLPEMIRTRVAMEGDAPNPARPIVTGSQWVGTADL